MRGHSRYDTLREWQKDFKEAAESFDVEKFKAFHEKWTKLGVYSERFKLPSDKVLEITMRKIVCNMQEADPEKLEEARQWLEDRGYPSDIFPI